MRKLLQLLIFFSYKEDKADFRIKQTFFYYLFYPCTPFIKNGMRKVISFASFVKTTEIKSGKFNNNIFQQNKKRCGNAVSFQKIKILFFLTKSLCQGAKGRGFSSSLEESCLSLFRLKIGVGDIILKIQDN